MNSAGLSYGGSAAYRTAVCMGARSVDVVRGVYAGAAATVAKVIRYPYDAVSTAI